MSGHARGSRLVAEVSRLTQDDLADLLRVAVQQCGRSDQPPTKLPDVAKLAAARLGRGLSDAVLWQLADAVVRANNLPTVAGERDPLVTVAAAVMGAREAPQDALHALLVEAWMAYEPRLPERGEPEPASAAELERADLNRLTLAGRYFLLAHDERGRALVSEPVCGLGLAGALLAELLLSGIAWFAPMNDTLCADADAIPAASISPVAEGIAARLRRPCPVGLALEHTACDAYERVREALLSAGILAPRESRQLLPWADARTVFAPVSPRLPEQVFNAVTALPTVGAARLDPHDAALIALVRATGLATASAWRWWMADDLPVQELIARDPGLDRLIGLLRAAVTRTVTVAQR